ncbi:hypothetical protein PRIC2_004008 [Phytophthora ramorum]
MTSSVALRHIPPLKVRSLGPREAANAPKTLHSATAIPLHLKLAVGGMAGAVGMVTTFPMDIVKTHLQGQTRTGGRMMFSGPLQCFQHIVATDGLRGLYRGLPPTLMGVLPEKAIKLAVNEQLREQFADADGHLSLPKQALAGAGAGSAQSIITNPVEIVKIRLQMQTSLPLAERQTAVEIARSLGFRGYESTGKNSVLSIVAAGAIAGAGAAAICTPADVIKTRLQMKGSPYTGMVDCVRKIVAANGPKALMKGAGPRMMVQAPLFGITLVAFELQKKYMESL